MIRVELGEEVKKRGKWRWKVPALALEGFSRQPLLDACREIKRTSEALSDARAGLYRLGREEPDLVCGVEWGAGKTVDESNTTFHKWKPWLPGMWSKPEKEG